MMATKTKWLSKSLMFLAIVTIASSVAVGAGRCCTECGCKKVKKVTRLVKSCVEVEIPAYERSCTEAYCPAKGIICHNENRCDKFYKIHSKWCLHEHRCSHESCEDVEHYVDKNPCDCECEHHEEHHHKKYVEYHVTAKPRHCVTCKTKGGCKTLYGASPAGCFKDLCVKKPTGDVCRNVVADVRWVTYNVCSDCKHSWQSDKGFLTHK